MKNFVASAIVIWLAKSGRYEAFVVSEDDDIGGCLKVLEEVRRKELNRVTGTSVLSSCAFNGCKTSYDLVGCRDTQTDTIIGCIKITKAIDIAHLASSQREYNLDFFDQSEVEKINLFTRLAILKNHRKSAAALMIMTAAFLHSLNHGAHAILMSCEPSLYKMYIRLGLRPFGKAHASSKGGYRIPMICIPDLEHFTAIKNPAMPFLKNVKWNKYTAMIKKYNEICTDSLNCLDPYVQIDSQFLQSVQCSITTGMDPKSCKSFLRNATMINCKKGDVIIAKNDGGKFFGIIAAGSASIESDGGPNIDLTTGEMFGEVAFILDDYRPTDVIATDDKTKILLYSVTALNRISAQDKAIIWRNFAVSLAKRFVLTQQTKNGSGCSHKCHSTFSSSLINAGMQLEQLNSRLRIT